MKHLVHIQTIYPDDPAYRGAGLDICYDEFSTELGRLLIAAYDGAVCFSGFADPPNRVPALQRAQSHFPLANFYKDKESVATLSRHFMSVWQENKGEDAPLKLALHGTEMQQRVWQALLDIPRGQTCSYKDIAKKIGRPKAARPVGNAVGSNPLSLLVPCHRVLPSSGKVGNYGWGQDLKKTLLEHEGALEG